MSSPQELDMVGLRRRDFVLGVLASGATVVLSPRMSAAQGVGERVEEYLRGELKDLKEDVREEVAKLLGMEAYVYGFPLVIMDLTRQVTTATPTSGEYAAPINQFGRIRTVVRWDFNNVVRISTNSLWSFGFIDLEKEPLVGSFPDTKGIPVAFRALNMWTDVFATGGSCTPATNVGDYLRRGDTSMTLRHP